MNDVKKKIEKYFKRFEELVKKYFDDSFLEQNYISLNETVTNYYSLKKVFKDEKIFLKNHGEFQKAFYKFYGINRFVSDDFKASYMNSLQKLKEEPFASEISIKEFVFKNMIDEIEDKKDKNNKKRKIIQFSFATKALNIFNDAKYPIYDYNVSKVFGVYSSDKTDMGKKLEKYIVNYEIIMEVYKKILEMDKYKKCIIDFREKFKYADESISDMRILDIIVWKLGEKK